MGEAVPPPPASAPSARPPTALAMVFELAMSASLASSYCCWVNASRSSPETDCSRSTASRRPLRSANAAATCVWTCDTSVRRTTALSSAFATLRSARPVRSSRAVRRLGKEPTLIASSSNRRCTDAFSAYSSRDSPLRSAFDCASGTRHLSRSSRRSVKATSKDRFTSPSNFCNASNPWQRVPAKFSLSPSRTSMESILAACMASPRETPSFRDDICPETASKWALRS
mmetsp:Transcript_43634/g.79553  ORF Transcript_43634/g.79553 Transcript_43634/m.79553 type:complete len:228 (+) Transcript_43634:1568-2251(+)